MNQITRGILDQLVDDEYLATCAAAWQLTSAHARAVVEQLDATTDDAPDEHRARCRRWLGRAATYVMDPDAPQLTQTTPSAGELAPTTELLRYVADRYVPFLRGSTTGQAILLAGDGLDLWYDYFQSRNYLYRPLNAAAAIAVFDHLRASGGTRILELGAGTGGATTHLVTAWPDDLAGAYAYTVTDTSARLLMATRRNVEPLVPDRITVDVRRFDFDHVAAQKVPEQSFDVVVAVNALHNADDVPMTLRDLATLLRPGGALVVTESLCSPGELVHQEFILNLLPLADDPPRFFDSALWKAHFAAAGIIADVQVNSAGPELVMVAVSTQPTESPEMSEL